MFDHKIIGSHIRPQMGRETQDLIEKSKFIHLGACISSTPYSNVNRYHSSISIVISYPFEGMEHYWHGNIFHVENLPHTLTIKGVY